MDKKTNDAVLTCGIARDLLPLYLDGLTSPESAAALEAHLASCPDCRAVRAALETPLPGAEESPAARSAGDGAGTDGAPPQTEVAEKVLKRAARRGWRKALVVMVVIALLIVGGMRFWDWGMGTPVAQKHIQIHAGHPERHTDLVGGGKRRRPHPGIRPLSAQLGGRGPGSCGRGCGHHLLRYRIPYLEL